MDISPYIQPVIDLHPEFTSQEIQDLCEEYISQFNKKTKEETKHKSLKKYLTKEFWVNRDAEWVEQDEQEKQTAITTFSAIPKRFFHNGAKISSDYILRLKNLEKQLGKTILFDDAELQLKAGAKVSLIGKNGAWKSTLLRILIGLEEMNQGDLEIAKEAKVWFLSQDLFWESRDRLVKEDMLTALPQVTKAMHRLKEIEQLLEAHSENAIQLVEEQAELIEQMIHNDGYQSYALQVEILKYFWFTKEQTEYKVSQLSWWEQTKVQIAKFLLQEVDILILDEPTNHLDIEGILFLEEFCELWGKTLICISHDKRFLNTVFDITLEITNKKLERYEWNYDYYLREKQKRYELQLKNYTAQQKYLKQQEAFITKFRYKSSKASQVQSRIKMLDKMDKVDIPKNDTTAKAITFKIEKRLPNSIMKFDELSVGYWSTTLISLPPRLEVTKDMRIGIVGKNGVGKTTLIKTILWEIPTLYWWFEIHNEVRIGSYSQVAEELNRDSSIIEELIGPGVSHKDARTLLGSLLVEDEKMDQKIWTLSGWERAKVALTKMLLTKPHVIIMDEPTNHLDIPSKEVIKAMLSEFDGVSLIVSHDRDFLEGTSNILRVIKDQQVIVYHSLERGFDAI